MKNKQTVVYIHFHDPVDLALLHRVFPEGAGFSPIMENSILISSHLTYHSVLKLLEKAVPDKEYFICVAGRHYLIKPIFDDV